MHQGKESVHLQAFCKLQQALANCHTAFTRQRTLVRTQHRPLSSYFILQGKRKRKERVGTYTRPLLYRSNDRNTNLCRLAPRWCPVRRLGGSFARRRLRVRACYRFVGRQGDGGAVVRDVQRGALEQGVASLPVVYLYPDAAPAKAEPEGQAGQLLWKLGSKAERAAVIAHAAKPSHRGDPGAGQGGQVNAIPSVVMEVSKVQESGFSEVVVG